MPALRITPYGPPAAARPLVSRRAGLHVAVLGCGLLLAGCDGTTWEPELKGEAEVHRLAIVSGDGQLAPADALLPAPLVVRVTNRAGKPAEGVSVRWILNESGGFRGPAVPASVTDQSGQATLMRRLGFLSGAYRTTAMVGSDSASAVTFTSHAHVQNATRMRPADSAVLAATDTVLATLSPHRLLVLDHLDRPVPGVVVRWTASIGSRLSSETSTTDASGITQVTHTLGARAGNHHVQAYVDGLKGSPLTFRVVAEPGRPVAFLAVAGDGQAGQVGTKVAPYAVAVGDAHGNGHRDLTVSWNVSSGGGVLNRTTSSTTERIAGDQRPVATAIHTLGATEEAQVVTATLASVSGFAPVSFSTVPATAVVTMTGEDDYYCDWLGICEEIFWPSEVQIDAGRSVLWVWSGTAHDVVFEDDPTQPASSGLKHTGTHFRKFSEPGTYRYRCTLHSSSFTDGMVGSVTVH